MLVGWMKVGCWSEVFQNTTVREPASEPTPRWMMAVISKDSSRQQLVLPACCSGSSHLVSILRPHSSGLRGRPTGTDGSHLVLMPPPSLGGGGSGGGSWGGPGGSFARTSLSHNFFAAVSCSCPLKHAAGPFYTLN